RKRWRHGAFKYHLPLRSCTQIIDPWEHKQPHPVVWCRLIIRLRSCFGYRCIRTPAMPTQAGASMSRSSLALSDLRAAVILIVLAFHSCLAYLNFLPATTQPFNSPPFDWQSFPIVDSQRWFGFDLFCALQNIYLMSLMFFLSGVFVWSSLSRQGSWKFAWRRVLRLGLPFTLAVYLLMPVAHYPVYLVTATDPSVAAFWQSWLALPFWPSGPPWFLWQLLALNIVAAGVHTF